MAGFLGRFFSKGHGKRVEGQANESVDAFRGQHPDGTDATCGADRFRGSAAGAGAATGGPAPAASGPRPALAGEEAGTTGSFEDAFMDAQADMVSICLKGIRVGGEGELGGRKLSGAGLQAALDDVYIYAAFWGRGVRTFNAFVRGAGEVRPLSDFIGGGGFDSVFVQVCDVVIEDMGRIKGLCAQWGRPLPAEIRGRYRMGGGYKAAYGYDEVLPSDEEEAAAAILSEKVKMPAERFQDWMERVRSGDDDLA